MSTYLGMAADDAERVDPGLAEAELQKLAAAVDGVIEAVGKVVNLETNYLVLQVLEARLDREPS